MPALATVREPARRQLLGCRPLAGDAPAVALGIELEDGRVVNKAVDRRDRDGGIPETYRLPPSVTGWCPTSR
jgi:hypothetical protein